MSLFTDKQLLAVGAVAVVGGVILYRKAVQTVEEAANAVNPMNPDNVIHDTAEQIAAEMTGNPDALQDGFDLFFTTFDFSNPNNWFNQLTGRQP